jgi:hypothetical protein
LGVLWRHSGTGLTAVGGFTIDQRDSTWGSLINWDLDSGQFKQPQQCCDSDDDSDGFKAGMPKGTPDTWTIVQLQNKQV